MTTADTGRKQELLEKVNHIQSQGTGSFLHPEDMGPGFLMRLKRLLRYRGLYLKRIWERSGLMWKKDVVLKTFWGRKMTLPNRDLNARKMFKHGILGEGEQMLIKFFIKNFKPGDVFYDVGANYGFYTALAQEFLSTGEIHAFEPSQSVYKYLKQLSKNHKNTYLNNLALSDVSGDTIFFDGYQKHKSGKSTLVEEVAEKNRMKEQSVRVKAMTIDEYVKEHQVPTIIKMDVEGGEYKVLRGGRETLTQNNPIISVELWRGVEATFSRRAVDVLRLFGYFPHTLTSEGEVKEMSYVKLDRALGENDTNSNFIFKKR